jgi:hypothetical protein
VYYACRWLEGGDSGWRRPPEAGGTDCSGKLGVLERRFGLTGGRKGTKRRTWALAGKAHPGRVGARKLGITRLAGLSRRGAGQDRAPDTARERSR